MYMPSPSFAYTPTAAPLYCDYRDEGWSMDVPEIKLNE